jgi:hypothetical protein
VEELGLAVANMMPVLTFTALAFVASRSSVSTAVSELLKRSDTLVVVAGGALGWGVSTYVSHVDKRFDAVDTRMEKRFDATDAILKELRDRKK